MQEVSCTLVGCITHDGCVAIGESETSWESNKFKLVYIDAGSEKIIEQGWYITMLEDFTCKS